MLTNLDQERSIINETCQMSTPKGVFSIWLKHIK